MTSTNTFQGINPADSKTTSKVLAPPGGKTSISLFGGEQSEPSPQPSQRGSRHPDRNASSVVFQSADQQAAKSGAAAKPGHDSANNLFGPPPARNSPKPKAPQDSHNAIFGKADPASTKPVQIRNPMTGEGITSYTVASEFRTERSRSTGTQWSPQKGKLGDRDPVTGTGLGDPELLFHRRMHSPHPNPGCAERNPLSGRGVNSLDQHELRHIVSHDHSPDKGLNKRNLTTGRGCRDGNVIIKSRGKPPTSPRKCVSDRDVIAGVGVRHNDGRASFEEFYRRSPSPMKDYRDPILLVGVENEERFLSSKARASCSPRGDRDVVRGEGVESVDTPFCTSERSKTVRNETATNPLIGEGYEFIPMKSRHSLSPKIEGDTLLGTDPRSLAFPFNIRPIPPKRQDVNPITGEGAPEVDSLNLATQKCSFSPRPRSAHESRGAATSGIFGSEQLQQTGERRTTKVTAPPGGKSQITFG